MRHNTAWDRIRRRLTPSRTRDARKRFDRRRLFLETLEGRRLLAGDLTTDVESVDSTGSDS
ncbi:MAG: hypothetical protein H6822_01345 [Planctomycetaceae bacterium]|nr:hypothetical protein [Planctomycetaceae bacterium]